MYTGVVDKRTSVPQIRPEILPLIGSALILGRDIQLLNKIGQGTKERLYCNQPSEDVELTLYVSCRAYLKTKLLGTFYAVFNYVHTH